MENDAEGFYACSQGSGFVVVNAILLGIAFCDISDFVACDVTSVIAFVSAYEFAFKGAFSRGEF